MLITNIKFIGQNTFCINKPAYLQKVSDPVFINTLVKLRHPAFSCILQRTVFTLHIYIFYVSSLLYHTDKQFICIC